MLIINRPCEILKLCIYLIINKIEDFYFVLIIILNCPLMIGVEKLLFQ